MERKLVYLLLLLLALINTSVYADFFYNPIAPKPEELIERDLKCIPGRTVIKISDIKNLTVHETEEETEFRRSHMNHGARDESCEICVCSLEGKDEYCSKRPARNVNECIRMAKLKTDMEKNLPYSHDRALAYRIRRVGDKVDESRCIPFMSEYSDCTDDNMCSGCTRCKCTEKGLWSCKDIVSCPDEYEDEDNPGEDSIYSAVDVLFSDVQQRNKKKQQNQVLVPKPPKSEEGEDILLVSDIARYEEDFDAYLDRQKRSLDDKAESTNSENATVTYHNVIDEINEDTLKNSNLSGTITAQKIKQNLKVSRRRGGPGGINKTELSSLHIEYNTPQDEHQFADNKIDEFPHDEKTIALDQTQGFVNYTQNIKDRSLSKIVVNELTKGKEIIGDKDVIPTSNITFTPENDTLTAMAFIAGNLLNKLWNMDKESSDSLETETLKHEKINDLLELFKEPLNLRQETFLKNALEKLSNTLNDNKNLHNVSICETLSEPSLRKGEDTKLDSIPNPVKCNKSAKLTDSSKSPKNKSLDVVQKLTDVLNLIKKFENTQSALHNLKNQVHTPQNESAEAIKSENNKFNLFASILEKITKLLLPSKHSHKLHKKMSKINQFADNDTFKRNINANDKIDLGNISITTKDKIILDYVNHIQTNPNCLLDKISKQSSSSVNLKGEIVDSLKEFFKIQSLTDLSKLIQPKNKVTTTSTTSTTAQPTTTTNKIYDTMRKSEYKQMNLSEEEPKLATVKEKLKMHLQSIVNDLAELQNEHGSAGDKKINLTDLLPCLGNILKNNMKPHSLPVKENIRSPIENIETLIEALKLEFTSPYPTRRAGSGNLKSTSAKIWKRVITNINNLRKRNMRRFDANEPKTYEDLKKMIEHIDKLSNSYKKVATLSVIPAHKRIMLLKTLEADVAKHKNVLDNIKDSFDTVQRVSDENRKELIEFIDNTATNVKLSNNVVINIKKNLPKSSVKVSNTYDGIPKTKKRGKLIQEKAKVSFNGVNKDFKLTRDQIINQLIVNRIQLYLKLKEEEGIAVDDVNYDIGKRALFNIQNGNSGLGRELFNILVQNKKLEGLNQTRRMMTNRNGRKSKKGSFLYSLKEPLLEIKEKTPARTHDIVFVK